jgi:hypothetical protein
MHKAPKSLMHTVGPIDNPRARDQFEIIGCLQKMEGVSFEIGLTPARKARG